MTQTKKASSGKSRNSERRFEGKPGASTRLSFGALLLGAFGLGSGIYAQWIATPTPYYAPWIVAISCAVLSVVVLWGDFGSLAFRIGDRGICFETSHLRLSRLAWCDIKLVRIDASGAHIEADFPLFLSAKLYPQALSWFVRELGERRPSLLKLDKNTEDSLVPIDESLSSIVQIDDDELLTGRRCAKSDTIISFERDALFCSRCGQIYHREHAPTACVTCGASIRRSEKVKA